MRPRIRFVRLGAVLAANTLLMVLSPAVVAAHVEIDATVPKDKSTVIGHLIEISATYTEPLAKDSRLEVTDIDGATVATGTVDPGDDQRMLATPDEPLGAGTFTVESTAIATDDHVERQTWTFTVEVPPALSPTIAVTVAPSDRPTAAPAPTPIPTSSATPSPAPSTDGGTPTATIGDVILPIIAALAIVAVGGTLLLGRRRRPGSDA